MRATLATLAASERARAACFWIGALAVTAGVALHLPMYLKAAAMNFHLAGMPVDAPMLAGMALIMAGTMVGGTACCRRRPSRAPRSTSRRSSRS